MRMSQKNALEELCYELALVERSERIDTLEQLTRAYPQHARELTEFAVDLSFDEERDVGACAESAMETDPIVARTMSNFQNRLYTLENEDEGAVDSLNQESRAGVRPKETPPNPFENLTHSEIRSIAAELGANGLLVVKLRDRTILPDTIPPGFRKRTAEVLGVPESVVAAHFAAPPELRSNAHYKSERKPIVVEQETFGDAVANSALTEEQQRYLLGL